MARFEIVFCIVLIASQINGQVSFEKSLGGTNDDLAYAVCLTHDGGYIIAGQTESYGEGYSDIYVIKTDSLGNISWAEVYGGSDYDIAYDIQQTFDSNYIIAGTTQSYDPFIYQIYLLKIDLGGDTIWTKTYGDGQAFSIQQTSDGGFIVTGYAGNSLEDIYDIFLLKTDSNGHTVWQKTYGDTDKEWAYSVKQTKDGGYIIAGFKTSDWDYYNAYLIKTDSSGEIIWERNNYKGTFTSVLQTDDGGYLMAGYYEEGILNYYAYLLKTDTVGDSLWLETYGMTDMAFAESVQRTADNGYILTGAIYLLGLSKEVYLVKTNQNGKLIWARAFGGRGDDKGYSVQQTQDGGYIVVGRNSVVSGSRNDYDFYLIKTNDIGSISSTLDLKSVDKVKLYPNPSQGIVNLVFPENQKKSIEIINSTGIIIYRNEYQKKTITLNIEDYTPGIYFIKINTKNDNAVFRIIKN